jgi:hypothetical protein
MNMQSSIIATDISGTGITGTQFDDPIVSIRQLLVVALALVDEFNLPGRIGADIDLAIHSASKLLPGGMSAQRSD